ncbi:MAG: thioesterase domain-containing protein [Bacteroidia bacterium]
MKNGDILCLGRTDNQVKIRGFRIEIGEIESSLNNLKDVVNSVVIAKEIKQDDIRLIAYVKSDNEIEFSQELNSVHVSEVPSLIVQSWKNDLNRRLPEYMMPSYFVYVKDFPLTATGKTDRRKISEIDFKQIDRQIETQVSIVRPQNRESENLNNFQKQLKEIWEETLEVSELSIHDNFFECGGHSLTAISIMKKIENHLGEKIPLASLFSHPTIFSLADFINGDGSSKWKYLVPIKTTGTKPPVYLIHGAGLEVLVFNDIAMYLDEEQPIYGIQAMGLQQDELPENTVEAIAAKYLKEVIKQNPDGPYSLVGFSAGSILAYEMARQLEMSGKNVSMLGNIDYPVESSKFKLATKEKLARLIKESIPRQVHAFTMMIKHPKQALEFQRRFLKLRVNGILSRVGIEQEYPIEEGLEHIYPLMDRYESALNAYEIKPYNGKLDLFKAKIILNYVKDKKTLGWRNYALKGVNIINVEGDHDNLIIPPNSKSFAKKLQSVIDKNITQYNTHYESNTNKNTQSTM